MRVLHSPWSWLNESVALDSVAGNTLMGMFTRLTFRYPFQVARAAMAHILALATRCSLLARYLRVRRAGPDPARCRRNECRASRPCRAAGAGPRRNAGRGPRDAVQDCATAR